MSYAHTVLQGTRRVAGCRLLPLSVGHALLLERMQSPFQPGAQQVATAADCALLLLVCSRSFSRAKRLVNSWRCKPLLWALWLLLVFRTAPARRHLLAYVSEAWTGPDVWVDRGGRPSGGGALMVIINTLCSRLGVQYEEALDRPLRQAVWDVCAYWAQDGAMHFMSPEEAALMDEVRKVANGKAT